MLRKRFRPVKRRSPRLPWIRRFTVSKTASASLQVQGTSDLTGNATLSVRDTVSSTGNASLSVKESNISSADVNAKLSVQDTSSPTATGYLSVRDTVSLTGSAAATVKESDISSSGANATLSVQVQDNDLTANAKLSVRGTSSPTANASMSVLGGDQAGNAAMSVKDFGFQLAGYGRLSVQAQNNDKTANATLSVHEAPDLTGSAALEVIGAENKTNAKMSVLQQNVDVFGGGARGSCLGPNGTTVNGLRLHGVPTLDVAWSKGTDPPTVPSLSTYAYVNAGDTDSTGRVGFPSVSMATDETLTSAAINLYCACANGDGSVKFSVYVGSDLQSTGPIVANPNGWVAWNWVPIVPLSPTDTNALQVEITVHSGTGGAGEVLKVYALDLCLSIYGPPTSGGSSGAGGAGYFPRSCQARLQVLRSPFWMEPDGEAANTLTVVGAADAALATHKVGIRQPTVPPGPDLNIYVRSPTPDNTPYSASLSMGTNVTLFPKEVITSITIWAYTYHLEAGHGGELRLDVEIFGIGFIGGMVASNPNSQWYSREIDTSGMGLTQTNCDNARAIVTLTDDATHQNRVVCVYLEFHSGSDRATNATLTVGDSASRSTNATMEVTRLATTQHRRINAAYRRMVEVDWPGGSRRYADSSFAVGDVGFDGKVTDIGAIHQGMNGQKDSVTVKVSNLPTLVPVESLWSDTHPPEGAQVRIYYWFVGDDLTIRVPVFHGVVEHVSKVMNDEIEFSAFCVEELNDLLLGKEINLTDFPQAPIEAVGKMQPIVFGTVPQMEAIPVVEVGKSRLNAIALKADTSLVLEDVSRFLTPGAGGNPSPMYVYVGPGPETISYTGRNTTTNSLTGCSARGADYAEGVEVLAKIELDVLASQHASTITAVYAMKGARFAKVDPALYTTPGDGNIVKFAAGWPLLQTPSGGSEMAHIQMDDVVTGGGHNTATNPLNAAAASASWSEKNPALIDRDRSLLELKHTGAVTPVGDILRVWLMLEFDDSDFTGAYINPGGIDQVRVNVASTDYGAAMAGGNLPTIVAQKVGLGTTRAYDDSHYLVDPTHVHSTGGSTTVEIDVDSFHTPATAEFGNISNAYGHPGASAANTLSGGVFGAMLSLYKTGAQSNLGAIVSVHAKFKVWNQSGLAQQVQCGNPPGPYYAPVGVGFNGTIDINVSLLFTTWTDFNRTDAGHSLIANVYNGASLNQFLVYGMWWEVVYAAPGVGYASTGVTQSNDSPLLHTVAYLADITAEVAGSWAWFTGRSAQVAYVNMTDPTVVKIKRLSFLIEHAAFRGEAADKILVDIQGLIPGGDPTDIVKEIVTNSILLNLPASTCLTGDFSAARIKYQAAALRLDFALKTKLQFSALLKKIAEQSRMLYWWEDGLLAIAYDPDVSAMPAPNLTLREQDIDSTNISLERTIFRDVITDVTGRYADDDREGRLSKVAKASVASTVGVVLMSQVDLELIQDDATAQNLVNYTIDHMGKPRFKVTIPLLLLGLEIRRADIVAFASPRRSYVKVQIQSITILNDKVTLLGTVWDTI